MTFGKSGRPPENRLLRQREIFEAVSPLILTYGARQLSMRAAAHAACLSIGGLYHYFPTKRDLILHGLDPQARNRICAEQREQFADVPQSPSFVDVCVDTSLRVIAFMRPSVIAARDLGGDTLQETLDPSWTSDVGELVNGFHSMLPEVPLANLTALARLIRRVMIGAMIERDVDMAVVRADLYGLIDAHIVDVSHQSAA